MTIKSLRQSAGMTWAQFADALGVSVSAVARWESGKCKPGVRTFASIGNVFGGETAASVMKEYFKGE